MVLCGEKMLIFSVFGEKDFSEKHNKTRNVAINMKNKQTNKQTNKPAGYLKFSELHKIV